MTFLPLLLTVILGVLIAHWIEGLARLAVDWIEERWVDRKWRR